MKAFFLFIFVLIALFYEEVFATADPNRILGENPQRRGRERREYCFDDSSTSEGFDPVKITAPATLPGSQLTCNKAYFFEITEQLVGYNIMIEIMITSGSPEREKFLPFLAVRKNERPQIFIEGLATYNVAADGFDEAGFNYSSNYHYYLLKKNSFGRGDKIYFSFYQRDQGPHNELISYNINITKHSDVPCPQDCSNQGTCDRTKGVCSCSENYFLPDCSIELNKHEIDLQYDTTIESNEWYYFYIDRSLDLETDLNVKVQGANRSHIAMMLRYQNDELRLPNEKFFHYIYRPRQDDNDDGVMSVSHLDLKKLGTSIVIGVKNQGKETFLSFTTEAKKRSPRYIVFLITGGILAMIVALLVCGIYIGERDDRKGRYGNLEGENSITIENQQTIELPPHLEKEVMEMEDEEVPQQQSPPKGIDLEVESKSVMIDLEK